MNTSYSEGVLTYVRNCTNRPQSHIMLELACVFQYLVGQLQGSASEWYQASLMKLIFIISPTGMPCIPLTQRTIQKSRIKLSNLSHS